MEYFSRVAVKYKQEHKKVPVLIIDHANRLFQDGQGKILDRFQNYAKRASDQGTVTVVFVSSEDSVPRRMMGKSAMLIVLFINYYLLIKCYRGAWPRSGDIIEIGNVSKEEAL